MKEKLSKKIFLAGLALVALLIASYLVWNYLNYVEYLRETVHETGRWAVIEDIDGHHLAVEPAGEEVWSQVVGLYQNGTRMWIGGIVEEYHNRWGFRLKPETITVAQFTAEGLQATIQYISENLDYW